MKVYVLMIGLLCSFQSMALTFTSTVHSIDIGNKDEFHLVRFDNGRVGFVEANDDEFLNLLHVNAKNNEMIEVSFDKDNYLVSAQSMGTSIIEDDKSKYESVGPYKPSIVKTISEASRIFSRMRRDYTSNGECYSRAHVWAYEEHQRSGLNLMKVFMFFTERYIRNYRYHWWFHVTPMVYLQNLNSPRTLDRRYTTGPIMTKTWSDVFIRSQRTCKKVQKFDEFWLNQQSQDCYHIHSSMYYVIPRDLEKRDLTGVEKTEFKEKEIKRAYRDGFNRSI